MINRHHAYYLFLCLLLIPQFIAAQNITTIAGTGTGAYNGDGIAATSAQLWGPQGLAMDASGNLYIADLVNSRIRKIDIVTGLISTVAGTATAGYNGDGILATSAQINAPSALSFDASGNLYFTDRGNHRIRKITTATGFISTVAGTGTPGYNGDGIAATTAQLNAPNEVAFDAAGNLYISDWQNNRVRKVDHLTFTITTVVGTGTAGYNGDGIAATTAQINAPCGIIFDNAGNMYLAEYSGHRVRKITTGTNIISTIAGTATGGYNGDGILASLAQLNGCAYIRFDNSGNLYIGDAFNARIRKITAGTNIITTVAGTGTSGYNGDGIAATSAQLNAPYNILLDTFHCTMYIADYSNNRIRKVAAAFSGCTLPVAKGNLVSCQPLPAITINGANNNTWVGIYDSVGNIAAEIKANGNNLGVINTSLFTKTGTCRIDGSHRIYLNRNITITPQFPLLGPDSVRLYILKAELDSLKTAQNNQGQPSGVASINDVDVFKNNDACATIGSANALPLTAGSGTYGSDYYLQVSIPSFSSFYFANKQLSAILPVSISSFTGKQVGTANILKWNISCNDLEGFNVERSVDGIHFSSIASLGFATPSPGTFEYTYAYSANRIFYYRIKINYVGGGYGYSSIILLQGVKGGILQLTVIPTIVSGNMIQVQATSAMAQNIKLEITDVSGRIILEQELNVASGTHLYTITASPLSPGIYWLIGIGKNDHTNVTKFISQY